MAGQEENAPARPVVAELTAGPGPLPSWVRQAVRPRVADDGPGQLARALPLTALAALALGIDLVAPNQLAAWALILIPVLVASWTLGTRTLIALLAAVLVIEAVGIVAGRLDPLAVGGRLFTVAVVTALARSAAVSLADTRRSRGPDMDVLMRSVDQVGRSFDRRRVADEAVRAAAAAFADGGRIPVRDAVLVGVAGDTATLLAGGGDAGAPGDANRRFARAQLPGPVLQVLQDGRPRMVRAGDLLSCIRGVPASNGIATWAVARVEVGSCAFGLLAVASADPAGFGDDDLRLLDGVARFNGLAIGAARREAELAEASERLQQSVELALEVGRSLEPEQVMDSVLVRLATSLEADQAALLRIDGQDLVVEATYRPGAGPATPTRRFPLVLVERIPQLARAMATGEPAIGGRLEAAPGAEQLAQALPTGVRTLILPYTVDGRTARVFALGRDEGRPFQPADVAHLVPMADVAVLALRNAFQHATAEGAALAASRQSGRLAEVIEAAEAIGSAEQLKDVVERARLLAVSVLRADRGNISRLEGDELVVEHDHRPSLPYARRRSLSRSRMAAEAVRTRRPVHGRVAPGSVGPDGIAWMVQAGILWAIQCPLIVGGEVVGVLGLGRCRDEPFTDADGEALLPFAKLVGLMLQNARRLAEARETGQFKSQFMTLAAHELRTPLAVIRGYLSLLEDGTYPVPERTRAEAVETLVSKAQELESLVESLVMAARLEGRALPHAATELDMGHEVGEAVERVRPRARLDGALVTARVLGGDHLATADRSHVALILNNLLNNALTYGSAPAEVSVEVRGAGDAVEVAVQDRGHGIPEDQHARVFERFHRVDVGPARTAAGLGLGLSISRELARLNGGDLLLERSAPGQGSVFVLRLRRARTP